MAEKRGETGKLICDFPTPKSLYQAPGQVRAEDEQTIRALIRRKKSELAYNCMRQRDLSRKY